MAVAAGGVRSVKRIETVQNVNDNINENLPNPDKKPVNTKEDLASVKKQLKKNAMRKYLLGSVAVVILTVVCIWFCYNKLFVVKKCNIESEGEIAYSVDEIMAGAGLEYGMRLYEFSNKDVQKNIKYNLPYIDELEIRRSLPDGLVLKVTPAKPAMYTIQGNRAFVLSDSLKVLEQTDDFEYIESNNLVQVSLSDVSSCVAGENMVTVSDDTETLKEIYSILLENNVLHNVAEIDMTDRFDLKLNYKSRYTVKLGDRNNLDMKIRFMIAIEEQPNNNDSGIIDVSDEDTRKATLRDF